MAKTKMTDKKEYGYLTPAQAAQVWNSDKPKLESLVKTADKPREKFNSTGVLLDPKIWPSLADVLLMKGVGEGSELDFGKLAEHFNKIIKEVIAGKTPEPKPLTGADVRKLALELTRKRLADAKAGLVLIPNDADALATQKEAKHILAKHGWDETPTKRDIKAKGKSKKAAEPVADPVPAQEPVKPAEKVQLKPEETASGPKSVPTETKRYLVKGCTPFIKEEFLKIGGGIYDEAKNEWSFPTAEKTAIAQKLIDDFFAKNKR